ncbi:hypothetical protein EJO70_08390 [Variovorax sp. 553]|nr:hypothetical protein EJO70_08390 [Variovorax sp. 553]RSZ45395.1 hypothetical protein EJO71_09455 [Variovorax sp. 679]
MKAAGRSTAPPRWTAGAGAGAGGGAGGGGGAGIGAGAGAGTSGMKAPPLLSPPPPQPASSSATAPDTQPLDQSIPKSPSSMYSIRHSESRSSGCNPQPLRHELPEATPPSAFCLPSRSQRANVHRCIQ